MSEKRKDNKGRILRTGESQRKDLIYQYRYTDIRGKRQTVYDRAAEQMAKIIDFRGFAAPEPQRKSG